jgi:dihydroorotate dehydrogenase
MSAYSASGLYGLLRSLLFRFNPETAHNLTFAALRLAQPLRLARLFRADLHLAQPRRLMGLQFPHIVGLAAGLDKEGEAVGAFTDIGFAFVEVGTVTPLPQKGNPKPRLFRLPEHGALINRMGFNNGGMEAMLRRLRKSRHRGILGINIGKQFSTPVEQALGDYQRGLRSAYPLADYIAVNISSPNTPNLRALQKESALADLLSGLRREHDKLQQEHGVHRPLVLKVAPDIERDEIGSIAKLLLEYEIDGLIATNTTLERRHVQGHPYAGEQGGLSGAPLQQRSTEVIDRFCQALGDKVPVIAAGGIMSGADAREKLAAGSRLVQIYTGFIYKGPDLISDILAACHDMLDGG